ncbi:hypothetical protein [Marinivivus vitaminiproducens]|uniref:hypothetical protein n=1 Tax=Marinivivus vitaminiproducens TaxID=3035935 RepID=UPI0027A62371|nr:hypothetical protein P4R82_16225 [Geminicoccaceae bacterium SCSIO 64248]
MNTEDRRVSGGNGEIGSNVSGLVNSFLNYLKTRTPETWLFFAAGIIVGMLFR